MIGVDPHKGSHTAVAIGAAEEPLGELRVRASTVQAQRLLAWAASWPERIWAIEGAGGLGHLLAQQLLAAGERVLDVQPKLGARVRLLAAGSVSKNDPNDARAVAVAALRSASRREVAVDDHAAVLKVWAKRYRDLGRARTQVACRCTPCCVSWSRVVSPRGSVQLRPLICWRASRRRGRWRQPAANSLPSSWRTCAVPVTRCAR
jgi:transposase